MICILFNIITMRSRGRKDESVNRFPTRRTGQSTWKSTRGQTIVIQTLMLYANCFKFIQNFAHWSILNTGATYSYPTTVRFLFSFFFLPLSLLVSLSTSYFIDRHFPCRFTSLMQFICNCFKIGISVTGLKTRGNDKKI